MKRIQFFVVMMLSCVLLSLAAHRAQAQINDPTGSGGGFAAPVSSPYAYEPVATHESSFGPWRSLGFLFPDRIWSFPRTTYGVSFSIGRPYASPTWSALRLR